MSSPRITYIRKRRSDDESSTSDSDEDPPAIKKQRVGNRESSTFPKYLLYIGDVFCSKFRNLLDWIYQLPVGYYERERMIKNTLEGHVPMGDDEDIDVIEIDTDDDDPIIEEGSCKSDKPPRRDNSLYSIPLSLIKDPLSSSTPFCKTARGRTLNSLSQQPVNGCNNNNNSKAYPTRNKRASSNHQKKKSVQYAGPITNPCSDVEILLDTRKTPDEKCDDLEIVSEFSNSKSLGRLTRQTLSPVVYKFGRASKECNGTSSGSIVDGKAASFERDKSSNKSFTANEVIRLQEKAHYQLILDKMIGTQINSYHSIVPKKNLQPAEMQVDLTGDDEFMIDNHMKKDILVKPVNEFLQKYYKPCQYKPFVPPKRDVKERFGKDDDVQVIEIDPPDLLVSESKPKTKPAEFFSKEWIEELKKTITLETEQRLQIVAAQEEKLERYRKRRDEHILKENIQQGQAISKDQPGKDEFPELTPDMDERIDWALGVGSQTEILSSFKDCTCTSVDLGTLTGLNWLNDSIINFYLALIMERGKNHPEYPPVYCFNSYFYTALKNRGPKAVLRWTRKIEDKKNIFQFDIVFVPLHLGMHWALCVIDNRTKKIKYYDSMQGTDDQSLRIVQNYLVAEKKDKLAITMDPNEYSIEMVKDIPQQMNGSDCGMFTLKYAEYLSRDIPITFSQEHMQYFRRRMIFEILDKKLF